MKSAVVDNNIEEGAIGFEDNGERKRVGVGAAAVEDEKGDAVVKKDAKDGIRKKERRKRKNIYMYSFLLL